VARVAGSREDTGNSLLDALDPEVHERLDPHLHREPMEVSTVLFDPGDAVDRAYFPLGGVVSLLTVLSGGDQVELATVGREGAVGVPTLLDSSRATARALVQVPGESLVIEARVLQEEVDRSEQLRRLLHRYTLALMAQIAQAVACNRLHPVEQRTARWLLYTHDRVADDEFTMTHEFLADMLGVRRASVTQAAGALQAAGLIEYRRGRVRVTDREGLERASCECYATVRDEYRRLIAPG
jgi:CRP-like cAMP-binding protein